MSFTETRSFAPRAVGVAPPPYSPRAFGLFSVATIVDFTDPHAANGITAERTPYAAAGSYVDGCDTAEDRVKVIPELAGWVEADPVTIFGGWECAPLESPERIDAYARQALLNGEERALEAFLATGNSTNAVATGSAWPGHAVATTTGEDLAADLGELEADLARDYGGQGVLHASVELVTLLTLHGLVSERASRLRSPNGNLVTANPYLDAEDVVVTGAVAVHRGPVAAVGDFSSMDRSVNSLTRLVERTSVVLTDFVLAPVVVAP